MFVSAAQQCELPVSVHISPPSWTSLLPLLIPPLLNPTPLGHHRARAEVSVLYSNSLQLSALYMAVHLFQCCSLSLSHSLSLNCALRSVFYICVSIPALQRGSIVPSFMPIWVATFLGTSSWWDRRSLSLRAGKAVKCGGLWSQMGHLCSNPSFATYQPTNWVTLGKSFNLSGLLQFPHLYSGRWKRSSFHRVVVGVKGLISVKYLEQYLAWRQNTW